MNPEFTYMTQPWYTMVVQGLYPQQALSWTQISPPVPIQGSARMESLRICLVNITGPSCHICRLLWDHSLTYFLLGLSNTTFCI